MICMRSGLWWRRWSNVTWLWGLSIACTILFKKGLRISLQCQNPMDTSLYTRRLLAPMDEWWKSRSARLKWKRLQKLVSQLTGCIRMGNRLRLIKMSNGFVNFWKYFKTNQPIQKNSWIYLKLICLVKRFLFLRLQAI